MATRMLSDLERQLDATGEVPLRLQGTRIIVGAVVFVLVSLWLVSIGHPVSIGIGVLGIVTFGFFGIVGIRRATAGPELTIRRGSFVVGRGSAIPYAWLERWMPSEQHRCVLVQPLPEHRDHVLAALPASWRLLARINALGFLQLGWIALPSNLDADARTTSELMELASGPRP